MRTMAFSAGVVFVLSACGGGGSSPAGGGHGGSDAVVATTSALPAPGAIGNLDWGLDASGAHWTAKALSATLALADDPVGQAARSILKHAEDSLAQSPKPLKTLDMDAELFNSQAFKDSDAAVRTLDEIFYWALCARIGTADLAPKCQAKAHDAILAWSQTYVATGNPIDEANLFYLMLAVDVLRPLLQAGELAGVDAWLGSFDTAQVRYDARLGAADTARVNNRNTWSLANAALVAGVRGDTGRLAQATAELSVHAGTNIGAGGVTYDFQQRDALHYQVYDLEAYLRMALLTPGVAAPVTTRVDAALAFLGPFYRGEQQHIEFVKTTVAMDLRRKEAGESEWQNTPWEPWHARELLKMARAVFADVRAWTEDLGDAQDFHPILKLMVALKEAVLRSSNRGRGWPRSQSRMSRGA